MNKMQVKITYLYHSSFLLEIDQNLLLFDYTSRDLSENKVQEILKDKIVRKNLYVFVSHAHGDHFDPSITEFSKYADKVNYVISHDVFESNPFLEFGPRLTKALPGSEYNLDDMKVKTFQSNDEGVAFLIRYNDTTIYFGGDLAKWDWPEWSENKRKEHVKIFEDVLEKLTKIDIDIAFSNMDKRLESWAGPVDFIEKVRPRYFVPIHTFGNEEWIEDLLQTEVTNLTTIFDYEKIGDEFIVDL